MKRERVFAQVSAPKLTDPNRARAFVIIARDARRAVVFRRGPTRKTRMLLWNLRDDTIEAGQWFFGRVYERRCDLSPDGELLVYFAAKHTGPYKTWTAVSRPPYFTALAFWPKGDTWGGGGLFESKSKLLLNHHAGHREIIVPPNVTRPTRLTVGAFGDHPGSGEDHPIFANRITRDGWSISNDATAKEQSFRAPVWIVYDPPHVRRRKLGQDKRGFVLRILTHGYHEQGGRNWVETADVIDHDGKPIRDFGRIDWADADHNGDILLSREGRLERLRRGAIASAEKPKVIADLHSMSFEAIAAPAWAETWDRRRPATR